MLNTEAQSPSKSRRSLLLRGVQWLFLLAIVGFLLQSLYNGRDQLAAFNWQANIPLLIFAMALLILYMVLQGALWTWMVRQLNLSLGYGDGIRIYLSSQLAKYVPGGVWSFASVGVSSAALGLPGSLLLLVYVVSMLFTIGISALFSLPVLWVYFDDMPVIKALVAVGLPLGLALMLPVLRWTTNLIIRWRKLDVGVEIERLTNYKMLFSLLFRFTMLHFMVAGCFFLYYWALVETSVIDGLYATMAWSGSWFIGLIVLIAPSGLGVREATLSTLLAPLLSPSVAIAVAFGYRVFTTVMDLLLLIGLLLYMFMSNWGKRLSNKDDKQGNVSSLSKQ